MYPTINTRILTKLMVIFFTKRLFFITSFVLNIVFSAIKRPVEKTGHFGTVESCFMDKLLKACQ